MAELVDALGSGPNSRKTVQVRVLFWALQRKHKGFGARKSAEFLSPYTVKTPRLQNVSKLESNREHSSALVAPKLSTSLRRGVSNIGALRRLRCTATALRERHNLVGFAVLRRRRRL